MLRNRFGALVALIVGAMALAGCGQSSPFVPSATIYGKVVDANTLQGVGGATVAIKINGAWVKTTTSTGTGSLLSTGGTSAIQSTSSTAAVDTDVGSWTIKDQPGVFSGAPMVVMGPTSGTKTYADSWGNINSTTISSASYGSNESVNAGTTVLYEGDTVTLYVVDTDTGKALTQSSGNAIPIVYRNSGTSAVRGIDYQLATQDSTDKTKYTYVIPRAGIGTTASTGTDASFFVPALDTNADGVIDYFSNAVNLTTAQSVQQANAPVLYIPVTPFNDNTGISLVATNFNNNFGSGNSFLAKAGPVNLFFNQPVSLDSQVPTKVTFCNDLLAQTTASSAPTCSGGYSFVTLSTTSGLTVAQALSNTMLTVTPSAALTENETYTFSQGGLTGYTTGYSGGAGYGVQRADLGTLVGSFRVTYTGTDGIGASSPHIIADNFNSCNGGTAIGPAGTAPTNCSTGGTASTVWLMFPEPVNGRIIINSRTDGSTTTTLGTTLSSLPCTSMAYYPKENTGGTDLAAAANGGSSYSGVACRVSTGQSMGDNTTGTASTLSVSFDVYDADGNHYKSDNVSMTVN